MNLRNECLKRATTRYCQLTRDKIVRLNTVRTFKDLVNSGVAHKLLYAIIPDVAVSSVNLHGSVSAVECAITEVSFDDRCQKLHKIAGFLAFRRIWRVTLNVDH
jgi:hypothetical protein